MEDVVDRPPQRPGTRPASAGSGVNGGPCSVGVDLAIFLTSRRWPSVNFGGRPPWDFGSRRTIRTSRRPSSSSKSSTRTRSATRPSPARWNGAATPRRSGGTRLTRRDLHIILICNQGYQSTLTAATLRQLGLIHATDLDGGFTASAAAGLPVIALGSDLRCVRSAVTQGESRKALQTAVNRPVPTP